MFETDDVFYTFNDANIIVQYDTFHKDAFSILIIEYLSKYCIH